MDNERNRFLHSRLYPDQCWHEDGLQYSEKYGDTIRVCRNCGKEGSGTNPDYFANGQVEDLIKRLVELGEWGNFCCFAHNSDEDIDVEEVESQKAHPDNIFYEAQFFAWLIQQPRFTTLLGEFLKERA